MRRARTGSACLAVVALACVPAAAVAASVQPALERALTVAGPDELVPVVVLMDEFPAQEELLAEVRGLNRRQRRARVVDLMQDLAARTQKPVHSLLERFSDDVRGVRVLWGMNGISLEATPRVIDELRRHPRVHKLLYDRAEPQPNGTGGAGDGAGVDGPNPEATVAPEVVAMGAQQVWDTLGYTGKGVLVAVIDTGIDPTHPDLASHIWTNPDEIGGNGLDDDGNGYIDDTWGWEFCADHNMPNLGTHGTQVAGQVVGDGTNGTVTGMAPDAQVMALGIDCDTPSLGWAASDYALAEGADIITQSYSWWWTDQPDYEAFRRQTDTELAAGVIHANSAGNHGGNPTYPIPYNVSTPANVPAPWVHPDQTLAGGVSSTIAVGNINWFTDVIAGSSSRGPSAWEDIRANTDPAYPHTMAPEYQDYPYENGASMGLIKPDISAYGDGTTTTCPGGSYCQFSGTSSATPHVSGTLALMLEANPEATPAELTEVLLTHAEHRGDPGKNNVYGVGLIQAYPAVDAIKSGVLYDSHTIDDASGGNGDLALDPGETVTMAITVRSVTDDADVTGLEAILSTTTPGVTIHNHHATYPTVAPLGSAISDAPHFTLTIDPGACSTLATFDLELRFEGKLRRSTFDVRIGDETPIVLLEDDFETNSGWTSDPGTTTRGAWVRANPIGVLDGQGRLSNPEDDTSDPGTDCWVTGNGTLSGKQDENNNDVDDGTTTLTSPPFGADYLLSLEISYDRWYYDTSSPSADSFQAEVSNDGGTNWLPLEQILYGYGGWEPFTANLMALLPPTSDMRVRFLVSDGVDDSPVEGAVDEVLIEGVAVDCQNFTPPGALPPNPVGNSLLIAADPNGHAELTWAAPPVDASHDSATLFRIERSASPGAGFVEVGSSTQLRWLDIDALNSTATYFYRIRAENSGGPEQ